MPLNTQITRNGKKLKIRWSNFHVAAMALASCFDAGEPEFLSDPAGIYESINPKMFDCYPDAPFPIAPALVFNLVSYPILAKTPLNEGLYVLKGRHKFWDVRDDEIFQLLPGDELLAVRGGR